MMSKLDRELTMILIVHDIALQDRRKKRTELSWPDESDIFIGTRKRIKRAFWKHTLWPLAKVKEYIQ